MSPKAVHTFFVPGGSVKILIPFRSNWNFFDTRFRPKIRANIKSSGDAKIRLFVEGCNNPPYFQVAGIIEHKSLKPNDEVSFGLTIAGVRSKNAARESGKSVRLGFAYRWEKNAMIAFDINKILCGNVEFFRYHMGFEKKFNNKFSLRIGSLNGNLTYGIGKGIGTLSLDYAVVKEFLPLITGESTTFRDSHFITYGLDI